MLVKNWMSKNVITVDENDSMDDATKRLKEHDIRMLPVMKKGKVVGIVTDRDFFIGRVTNKVIHMARDRTVWVIR